MTMRIVSMSVLSAALLLQPIFGGGLGQAMAESRYVNFTKNETQKIELGPGVTDVYPTCYNLDDNAYYEKTGHFFTFNCTSSEVSLVCTSKENNNDHCHCNNQTKETHTVKVHMDSGCKNPS